MKKMTKIALSVATLSLFVVGCATGGGDITAESLSLRKAPVHTEAAVTPQKVTYTAAQPGKAKLYQRSFQDAPPLIPHSVKGFVPITKGNNACLGCHMPEVAKSMHATPIPPSHFTSFRPVEVLAKNGKLIKKGKVVAKPNGGANEVFETPLHGKLYAGRYNCTQCHVPQANVKPLVGNTFQPGYKSPNGAKRSNLIHDLNAGVNTD